MTLWMAKAHRGVYSTNKSRPRTVSWLIMRRRLIGSLAAVSICWILFSRVPAQLISVNIAIVLLEYFLIGFSQVQLNTIERRSFIYFLFIVEPNLQFNLNCIKVYPSLGQCIAYLLYSDQLGSISTYSLPIGHLCSSYLCWKSLPWTVECCWNHQCLFWASQSDGEMWPTSRQIYGLLSAVPWWCST